MNDFEVLFYETESGEMPAMDFLDSLDIKMRAKAARTIKLLQANGNSLREPHSKPVADGIFELRVQVASNISRVLYFFAAQAEGNIDQRVCQENCQDAAGRD